MDDFSSMRYAHSDGHTDICFDETGSYLVTCGTDGDIRIWNGFEDDDPQSQNMGQLVTAVALKNKMLYVANDAFTVSAYTFPEIDFESIIAQFTSAVYHIVCSGDGNLIASGGGDFVIKVYDTSSKTLSAFRGHDGPILSLAFDTKGKYLASSGCDKTVRIWQLFNQECIKTLYILKKLNDISTSSSLSRLSWSPDGQLIAIPVESEVHLYQRDTWECAFSLKDDCIIECISIATFSPFGTYVAAASINGQMVVWDLKKKSCISRKMHEKKITVCSLAWNPSGKDLAYCDIEGQLGIYESPLMPNENQKTKVDKNDIPINFECEADEDDKDFDDAANDLDLLHDAEDDDDDDDNAFDIGAIKASLEPKIFGTDDILENESVKSEKVESKVQVIEAPKPVIQTVFQPSSTPVHLERRFMLWNTVGIVRCYNTDEENSIDVEFHDANVYHSLHLNNTRNHTLAALSTEALLLACPKLDDNSSKLECLHFGTWDSNKEWVMEMPENEDIESITLGEGFAACITDKRLLRIFTISGVQCEVLFVPGPVICSSAREKQIVIAYHRGLGIENDQCLNLMIVDVKLGGHTIIRDFPLPLSPKSFLSWLGYSDEGHPCSVDSSGVVSLLNTSFGMKWIPVAHTRSNLRGISDTYFVLGLSEIKQEIRCILCKGSKYPALLPRPTVAVVPFNLPFCEMSSDKGRFEEENRRCAMTHKLLDNLLKEGFDVDSEYNSMEKKWMDILLKMFALATRTDHEYRALDIAEMMPNTVVIQGAIKYATQRHRMALAERLGEVMNKKLLASIEDAETDPVSEFDSINMSQDSLSVSSLSALKNAEDNDAILKPKPLFRSKFDAAKSFENSSELSSPDSKTNTGIENISLLAKSSPVSNPFKAKVKSKIDGSASPGIDNMLDNSMKNLSNKSNSSTPSGKASKKAKSQEQKNEVQTTLNKFHAESQPKKFGFQLFLEQSRDSILCTSDSEMSESEVIKTAMKLYKELPASEKQKYVESNDKKSMTNGSNGIECDKTVETHPVVHCSGSTSTSASENSSKRKEDEEDNDNTPKPKKLKSSTGKVNNSENKLTQFAFFKRSK